MKTYTMSWKMYGRFGNKSFKSFVQRIWPLPWRTRFKTPLEFFLSKIPPSDVCSEKDFRLSCCGKLIARQATYQGV